VWDENMGRYLQWLCGETPEYIPVPKPPLPPKPRPKSDKAKAYEEMIDYANLGINIEDNRPYDPMEIDLALVNLARRVGGNVSTPVMNITNTTRTVRKKKAPVKKRVIKKVVRPKKRRVNLVTYEEPAEEEDPVNDNEEEVYEEIVYEDDDDENDEYVEVEDNSTVAMNLVKKK
jgi:hypothetical protein